MGALARCRDVCYSAEPGVRCALHRAGALRDVGQRRNCGRSSLASRLLL